MADIEHIYVTYNDIHNIILYTCPRIAAEFKPDLMIAIGGGGYFPARVMRTFLRESTNNKTLRIYAIGLSLYEPLEGTTAEQIGTEVVRTQWLGPDAGKFLLGKCNLIVDEVDDSRTTLSYALSELQRDVEDELLKHPESERATLREATKFAVFVVHNKATNPKRAELPPGVLYFSGAEVGNVWVEYPWEARDIEAHDKLAAADRASHPR